MTRRTPRTSRNPPGTHPTPGRPGYLTNTDTANRILKALKTGLPLKHAAAAAGISYNALNNWTNRGIAAQEAKTAGHKVRKSELVYLEFAEAVARARAEGLERCAANIANVAEGGFVVKETTRRFWDKTAGEWVTETDIVRAAPDWRASAWVLERTDREHFGRSAQVEVSGRDGGPIEVATAEFEGLASRVRANLLRLAGASSGEIAGPAGGRVIEGELDG